VRSFPLAFVVLGVSQHVFDIANLLSEADTRDDSIVVAANVEDVPVIVDIDRVQGLSQVVETLRCSQSASAKSAGIRLHPGASLQTRRDADW
jgi:hypothetical protein